MIVQVFTTGPLETNSYVIACPLTHAAAVIDPAADSARLILQYLEQNGLKPEKILLTHSHWDHIVDCAALQEALAVPVYVHTDDAHNVEVPGSDGMPIWCAIDPVTPDVLLRDGDEISVGRLRLLVMHTPGHSPGGVCYYSREEKILFAGDTLFKGSIGNLTLPTAEAADMWKSLERLALLPSATTVLPGHGEATTIGDEDWLANAKAHFGG